MITEEQFAQERARMVAKLRAHNITDLRVLTAMEAIPRHLFVAEDLRNYAYDDHPLPIGEDQTISQPYIVALMIQMLGLKGGEKVLEVGTGSGYQTALLCHLAAYVYTLERHARLADQAAAILNQLKIENVDVHVGDGSQGLPDMSPFDAILVSAAAPMPPDPLIAQLNPNGGRLVIPIGDRDHQQVTIIQRKGNECTTLRSTLVQFVPLIGRYGFRNVSGSEGS